MNMGQRQPAAPAAAAERRWSATQLADMGAFPATTLQSGCGNARAVPARLALENARLALENARAVQSRLALENTSVLSAVGGGSRRRRRALRSHLAAASGQRLENCVSRLGGAAHVERKLLRQDRQKAGRDAGLAEAQGREQGQQAVHGSACMPQARQVRHQSWGQHTPPDCGAPLTAAPWRPWARARAHSSATADAALWQARGEARHARQHASSARQLTCTSNTSGDALPVPDQPGELSFVQPPGLPGA